MSDALYDACYMIEYYEDRYPKDLDLMWLSKYYWFRLGNPEYFGG